MQQAPVEGVPINYSFDDAEAPTTRTTQYFEMLGNRAIIHDGWKAVTFNGRLPWESRSRYENIDEQQWELYNVQDDPAEAHDLLDGKSLGDLDDPMVKKLIELVGMWWAEAGRYNVLPLDDRFNERLLGRGDLYTTREQLTCGRVRGEVSIATRGAPGSGLGTVLLAPAQNGSRMNCTATVEFKVPLVGGKIESVMGRSLAQQFSVIQRFTAKWITEHA